MAGLPSMLIRAVIITLLASGLGIGVNFVSPHAVPLFGPVPAPDIEGVDALSLADAWALFQDRGRTEVVFVDARDDEDYGQGHIPGAMMFSAEGFEEKISSFQELIPADTLLVTYCSGAECDSSKEVASLLRDAGYTRVKLFFGGWEKWAAAGYPAEQGP